MNFLERIKLQRQIKKHINRPLNINEILSRQADTNVVVDAYEFFMRKFHWSIDECASEYIKIFLFCVLYDGEVCCGGISQFLASNSGNYAHQTADALHTIGAFEAESLLRRSFSFFDNGVVPENEDIRNQMLDKAEYSNTIFKELDTIAYNTDISSHCYKYLMNNKTQFLMYK